MTDEKASSAPPPLRLETLPEKWRTTADALGGCEDAIAALTPAGQIVVSTYRACADELEAALTAAPSSDPSFHETPCWICHKPVPLGGPFTNRCWPPCDSPTERQLKTANLIMLLCSRTFGTLDKTPDWFINALKEIELHLEAQAVPSSPSPRCTKCGASVAPWHTCFPKLAEGPSSPEKENP